MISVTTSPFSFNIRRSTPCVLGCCGPMLTYISSIVSWEGSAISISCGFIYPPCLTLSLHRLVRNESLVLVILAQRMPYPVLGSQDPPKVRMTIKADSHHVESLPFVPVCRSPQRHHTSDDRIFPRHPYPHQDLCRLRQGGDVVDHLEFAAGDPIYSTQAVQIVEPYTLERRQDLVALLPMDIHPSLATLDL